MKIDELIDQHFSTAAEVRSLVKQITRELGDEQFALSIDCAADRASTFLGTARIQQHTTSQAGAKTFGFDELIQALENMPSDESIGIGLLTGQQWGGRLHYRLGNSPYPLLGLAIVKKKEIPKLKTPPDWDGSDKMLREYNKTKQIG